MTPMNHEPKTSLPPEASKRIGLRLVERGLLSAAEYVRALSAAAQGKLDFTDTVVGLGLLTEDQVAALIAEEFGIPYDSPYPDQIDPQLLARFPAELLLRYKAVPFAWADGRLTLATSEVPTLTNSKSFESACEGRIAFSFGSRRQIARTLRTLLPQQSESRPAGPSEDLDDPGAVGLLYRHLAQAVNEDADEVRFEPADGETVVQYRFEKRQEIRGRYAASTLLGLTARARVLIGTSPNARYYDLNGTLVLRMGKEDITIDVAITPTKVGESVVLRIGRQAHLGRGACRCGQSQ
jgi:type II secretory ATPase GspE/PulE/Tfp pilus assembly ATPase PilB-like protein